MSSAPDSSLPRFCCSTIVLVVIGCLFAALLVGMALPVSGDVTPAETTSDRSLTSTVAAPNGTVQITTEVSLDTAQNVSLLEEIDPGFGAIELVDTDGATDVSVNETNSTIEANFTDRDAIAFTYRLTVSGNASIGDIVSVNGTVSGDVNHDIGVDEIEVVDDPGAAVWLSEVPAEQVAGESTTVQATVEHLNDSNITTDVTFRVDGDEVHTEAVSLGSFEQDNVSFEWTPASDDIGTVSMRVETATHNDSASVDVLEPATFAVSDLDAPGTVTQYETFTPTVEVENTGDVAGTQTITLSLVDGDDLASKSISLDAGETTIVSFDDIALETPGVHELEVESEDDSTDRPIVVEETTASRTLNSDVVGANGTVQITISASVEEPQDMTLVETIDPAAGAIEVVDSDGADSVTVDSNNTEIEANFTGREQIEFIYRLTIPGDAAVNDTYTLDGSVDADQTLPTGTDEITVSDTPGVAIIDIAHGEDVVAGEPLSVTATVENLAGNDSTTDVSLSAEAASVDVQTVTLGAFEQREVTLSWTPTVDDVGEANLTVETDTHDAASTVTVLQPATFELSGVSAPDEVVQYGAFNASVTVENTGDVAGTDAVSLSLADGTELNGTNVTLEAGVSTTVTFDALSIAIEGVHTLVAATDDSEVDRPIVVEPATAEIAFEDQLLGTTSSGDSALYVSDLVADVGWTVVLVDADDDSVVGMETLEEAHTGGEAIVPVTAPDGGGMDIHAFVVADGDGIVAGEAVPEDVDRLAASDGIAFQGSIITSSLTYEDATEEVYIDAATLVGGDGSTDLPFIVGVYGMVDGERELLGYEAMLQGTHEDLSIGLDEELDVGEYELVAQLHAIGVGGPGQAYRQVQTGAITENQASIPVTIEETPQFVLGSIDHAETVSPGGTLSIAVTVHNEGTVSGTQSIWVSMGQRVVMEDVYLEANESATVSLSLPISGEALGTYSVDVEVDDSATSFDITVQEPSTESDSIPGFTSVVVILTLVFGALVGWRRH